MIAILDYGMGNLRSVQKAFEHLGFPATLCATPSALAACGAERLVLPGVGAFADGMRHLEERGFIPPLRDWHAAGRPLFGVCLGMQLLFESSTEGAPADGPPVPGLGLLKGRVRRFDLPPVFKVPHMGWNALVRPRSPLFAGVNDGEHVYFVHSYFCTPDDPAVVAAGCDYGGEYCAAVQSGNLSACQFHPEKSQAVGLKILGNWARM